MLAHGRQCTFFNVHGELANNGYPKSFVDRRLARLHQKADRKRGGKPDDNAAAAVVNAPTATISMAFVDGPTQALQRVLKPLGILEVAATTCLEGQDPSTR